MSASIHYLNRPYAELYGGILSGGPDRSQIGKAWYFVDYIDEEGGRLGVWDGPSYDDGCEALADWRKDGVRTMDLLREALR